MIEGDVRLFSTDLDGTLIGNSESMQRFKETWENLSRENRPLLVYNSGRSASDIFSLLQAKALPEPDYIIGRVGIEFHDTRNPGEVKDFVAQFGEGWDLPTVERIVGATPGIERQPPEFLHPYKSSWYLERVDRSEIEELRGRLEATGLQVTVVYSSLRHLDVLPRRADKGKTLEWLCRRISVPLKRVLVAGDTGNDSSMFLLPEVKGIVVENAQPELFESVVKLPVFGATKVMADGVLEGMKHFGVISVVPRPRTMPLAAVRSGGLAGRTVRPEIAAVAVGRPASHRAG